ncbi:LpsH [Afipia sp. P52-10]|uniref:O-antigen ligase family protein n=1 Tax=Afipia sp. P52-10 TaxID=1429916 RepID=UPI0003DF15A9|nr:LpsH [Afipia sp. P52-10]
MTYPAAQAHPVSPVAPGLAALQHAMLWLVGACGAVVMIEPSPYELATLSALIVFFATGLKLRAQFMPLLFLLIAMNIGYSTSAASVLDKSPIVNWIATSWYLAITAMFFAIVLAEDTEARLHYLLRGYVVGALVASLTGIGGYFGLIPGGYDLFTLYGRAKGTFKDPNVLGAFLILPALVTLQSVLIDRLSKAMRSGVILSIISLAILLSFSRAAWGQLVATSAFVVVIMFLMSKSQNQRLRIVLLTCLAVAALALLLVILLSLDSTSNLFRERASLEQSYDSGRFGRFGRHILGAQMALDLPFGIGPLQFTRYFPEDTHNSFLNAFMSGGWIAGVCYPALVLTTVIFGLRYLFVEVPWRRGYIAVLAAFLGTVAESFIIDTDHWRHFFLLIGAMWGMFAAAQIAMWRRTQAGRAATG